MKTRCIMVVGYLLFNLVLSDNKVFSQATRQWMTFGEELKRSYTITHFSAENVLPQNWIRGIEEDRNGFVWVVCGNGLLRYDGKNFERFTASNSSIIKSNDMVRSFHGSDKRDVFFEGDYYRYHVNANSLLEEFEPDSASIYQKSKVFSYLLLYGRGGTVWQRGTNEAYIVYNFPKKIGKTAEYISEKGNVNVNMNDDGTAYFFWGDTLVGLDRQLHTIGFYRGKPIAINVGIEDKTAMLLKDSGVEQIYWYDDLLWYSTRNSIYIGRINNRRISLEFLCKNVCGERILYAHFSQRLNSYFFGTGSAGLLVVKANAFQKITVPQSDRWYIYRLAYLDGWRVVSDLDMKRLESTLKVSGSNLLDFNCMQQDRIGNIYYDLDYKLHCYDRALKLQSSLPHGRWQIKQLLFRKDTIFYFAQDTVWYISIGYFLHGQCHGPWGNISALGRAEFVTACFMKDSSRFLIGNTNGLFVYNRYTHNARKLSEGSGFDVKWVKYDPAYNGYWVMTLGRGVYFLDSRERLLHLNTTDVRMDYAYCIAEDKYGYCWFTTNSGLFRILKNHLWEDVQSGTHNVRIVHYGKTEGQMQGEFNGRGDMGFCTLPGGDILFPAVGGIVRVSPGILRIPNPDPKLIVESILLDDIKELNLAKDKWLEIPYNYKKLAVKLLYLNPSEVWAEYKIDGARNSEWKAVENNLVEISQLGWGDYTLIIRISGQKKHQYHKIYFTILPIWYQSRWFRALAAAVILFVVWWLANLRVKQVRRRNQLQQRMLQSELKALRSQINPHYLSNVMTSIQKHLYSNDVKAASDSLVEFGNLMRVCLNNSEHDFVPLLQEIDFIERYILLEKNAMGKDVFYSIDYLDVPKPHLTLIPSMLLQPIVENALHHGLDSDMINEPELNIYFGFKGKLLECRISDNGVGADAGSLHKRISGHNLSKSRLETFGKLMNQKVQMEFIETKQGTTIMLYLPYKLTKMDRKLPTK